MGGYLRNVKPADSVQGNALFDAPPAHYKLSSRTRTASKFALIDIPLTFGAERPNVASPRTRPRKTT